MVRMNFRSPKPQANPKPGELQHDSDDKDNQLAAMRVELASAQAKVAALEAENAALLLNSEQIRALKAELAAVRCLPLLGLSPAHHAKLQPVTSIICEPEVTNALAEPATTTDAVTSAVKTISDHLQTNSDQLSAYLRLFDIGTTTDLAGCSSNSPALKLERLATAAALSLVALRNTEVRHQLRFMLVPAHTGSATDSSSSFEELNESLYKVKTWEHEGRSAGEAVRDVMWYALGDGVAGADLFTKIERVAGALMVGVLARDGFIV